MGAPTRSEPAPVHGLRVTEKGVLFAATGNDTVVDVHFDGRRVWSFWSLRDTEQVHGERLAEWPDALTRFLNGSTTVSLVEHLTGSELASVEATLGEGAGRIAVVDKGGRPLGLDKSLSLSRLFDSRDAEQLAPLLDSIDTVLAALRDCGIDAFLAYGSLLGAVREKGLIGHDSDADLGYVSRFSEPVDAIMESFRLQRRLVEKGYWVVRYSGLAFRVNLREGDGALRGLDVFGGILRDGHLYLMGEVGSPFRPEWVLPLSEVTLEGRTFAAPAEPERLLEAMYGPHWRTPDPAFKFETSTATRRRLDGWFRGTRGGRNLKWEKAGPRAVRRTAVEPSDFAAWVLHREPHPGTFIDIGCGSGADAYAAAARGIPAWGLDFRPSHYRGLEKRAARESVPVTYHWANLNELRSVLSTGARLSREPGPRVVLGRHLADSLDRPGRAQLLLLGRMLTRDGGRLYLQVLAASGGRRRTGEDNLTPLDVDELVAAVEASGGTVEVQERLTEARASALHTDVSAREGTREVARLGITWQA
jgi:hypothetical protein